MKLIFRYLGRWKKAVAFAIGLKLPGSFFELLLPYIFEHIIDEAVEQGAHESLMLQKGFCDQLCASQFQ